MFFITLLGGVRHTLFQVRDSFFQPRFVAVEPRFHCRLGVTPVVSLDGQQMREDLAVLVQDMANDAPSPGHHNFRIAVVEALDKRTRQTPRFLLPLQVGDALKHVKVLRVVEVFVQESLHRWRLRELWHVLMADRFVKRRGQILAALELSVLCSDNEKVPHGRLAIAYLPLAGALVGTAAPVSQGAVHRVDQFIL